jgi:hypothetical protein
MGKMKAWRKMSTAAEGDISNRVFSRFKIMYTKEAGVSDLLSALMKRL